MPGNRLFNGGLIVLAPVYVLLSVCSENVTADALAAGKSLAMDKSKGNCLACHVIDDGQQPGNIGPPLMLMKQRFPDADVLFNQIWDATRNNPDTRMPPFGRHGILSREEIEKIIGYLYTL